MPCVNLRQKRGVTQENNISTFHLTIVPRFTKASVPGVSLSFIDESLFTFAFHRRHHNNHQQKDGHSKQPR
jgi:hypothetical protein